MTRVAPGPWLALDTATPVITVAVHEVGSADDVEGRLLAEHTAAESMRHGEHLMPAVEAVLEAAGVSRRDLVGVVTGVGPGPYTGLRVGVVTARVLALALRIPAHGVLTHDAIARGHVTNGAVAGGFVVTTDARRKELFWAAYDAAGRRLQGPGVDRPDAVAELAAGREVVGAGPRLYPDAFEAGRIGPDLGPRASDLAALLASGHAHLLEAEPVYLRRPDAVVAHAPKPVT